MLPATRAARSLTGGKHKLEVKAKASVPARSIAARWHLVLFVGSLALRPWSVLFLCRRCHNSRMTDARRYEDAWLVIPFYNEAGMIGEVIADALPTFPNIVCVDDGSTDGSARVAREAGATVVRHPFNMGQGAALQTGIDYVVKKTDGQYLVTFDADGQHIVSEAADMVDKAEDEDLAIIFGSRFLDDTSDVSWPKRTVLKTAAAVTRWKTGLDLTDAHNGLRVLRRDAARQVNLTQNRMAHASEIVARLGDTGLAWAEMPVHIAYTEYSKSKGQPLLNSVNILVDLVMR